VRFSTQNGKEDRLFNLSWIILDRHVLSCTTFINRSNSNDIIGM
jgi:hypothetical protein